MPKTALVLSGGGAKGAFQVGAERYLREERGYSWDLIAGVSVGALNASMLAMQKYAELWGLWDTVTNDRIYRGRLPDSWFSALIAAGKALLGHKSLLDNAPLASLIAEHFDSTRLVGKDVRVGAVSLQSGEFKMFRPSDGAYEAAVLASTAMPVYWAPVQVSAQYPDMVDGGVRNISPLGEVIDDDPDEIVIINCSPREHPSRNKPFGNYIEIALRTIEVMLQEIFVTDLQEFLRINDLVDQAAKADPPLTLRKPNGTPFQSFRYKLIEPTQALGHTLDFSHGEVVRRLAAGRAAAESAFAAG
jgi:NTE family protein